jgi:type IV pilus assembly protein PilE
MRPPHHPCKPKFRGRGFTLIELMIATAISAILASVAYPTFSGAVLKARRTDALSALMNVHLTQERWRSGHASYATATELRHADMSPMGLYRVSLADTGPHGFSATAAATGLQAADAECRVLRLNVQRGQVRYASGSDDRVANAAPVNKRCWNL